MSNNNPLPPGFNGQYDFDVKEVLGRAVKLVAINNWVLAQSLICILLITFFVYFIFLNAYNITDFSGLAEGVSPLSVSQQAMIELTLTCLLAPLWAGVGLLAIRSNRGEKPSFTDIFFYYRMIIGLSIASLIVSLLFTLGLSLYVIPGFYLFVATTFTLPLMADKQMRPLAAIIYSVKMTNVYLWKMLTIYSIFLLLLVVVLLSFGFAYLWVGPFYFNVKAILYEDLFCSPREQMQDSELKTNNDNEGVFDA